MQHHKPRLLLFLFLGFLLLIISLSLLIFFIRPLIMSFYLHWLFVLACVLIVIFPTRKIKLENALQQLPLFNLRSWLMQIGFLQACLLAIFIGLCTLINITMPIMIEPNPQALASSLQFTFIKLGLFPWPAIAVVAISMGTVSYRQQQDAFMHRLLQPLINSNSSSLFGRNVNIDAQLATRGALSSTFSLIAIAIAHLFSVTTPLTYNTRLSTFLVTLLLLFALSTQLFKTALKKFLMPKNQLWWRLFLTILLLGILLFFLNWLLAPFYPIIFPIPLFTALFQHIGPTSLWLLFSITWWSSWLPLVSAYIARISRGYAFYQVILASLLLPFLLALLLYFLPQIFLIRLWQSEYMAVLLSLAGLLGLLKCLGQRASQPALILSYLPKNGLAKPRDHVFYFRKLSLVTGFFIFLFLPTGLLGASAMLLTLALCMSVIVLLVLIVKLT